MMLFKERGLTIFINCFGRSQWREAETLAGRERCHPAEQLSGLRDGSRALVETASVTLIPKKEGVEGGVHSRMGG